MTPVDTPTPAIRLTPTPTLCPPVTLEEPENGSRLEFGATVMLRWSAPYDLLEEEYYQLRIQVKGHDASTNYPTVEDHYHLPILLPGEYIWSVSIVRSVASERYELVSKGSEWRSFQIVPLPPVVHSISPTDMLQGMSALVVMKGENLVYPLTLTIGIPLQVTYVNSSTITATVPTTLEVGEYPVIIMDSNGRGVSSAFFAVKDPSTPMPTASPFVYRPPTLDFGGIICCSVTLRWKWAGTLAENEWFAIRIGKLPDVPHSQTWTKEREYTFALSGAGDYVWEVAICRGDPATAACNQLAVSEQGVFSSGCDPNCQPPSRP